MNSASKKKQASEVDDQFFNLEEFNKWTDKQEELDMLSDREDQDEEFDFDNDLDGEEDSEEEEGEDAAGNLLFHYSSTTCVYINHTIRNVLQRLFRWGSERRS